MQGYEIEGVLEAREPMAVVEIVRAKSFYPLEIKQIQEKKDLSRLGFLSKVSSKDLSIFCKQYTSILSAGISITQGLWILANQTINPHLKNALKKVSESVQTGQALSVSMAAQPKCFPIILIRAIEAGEVSGTLETSLERMALNFEREYILKQKIRKALVYPAIVSITAVFVIIFLLRVVVPQFTTLFEMNQAALPLPTRIVLGLNNFLSTNLIWLLLIPLIIYVVLKATKFIEGGNISLHKIVLKLPYLGLLMQNIISARFNYTMSTLLTSGISLTHALNIALKTTKNPLVEKNLEQIIDQVRQGKGLAQPLDALGIFPPGVVEMIAIGEESGRVDDMMEKTADLCQREAEAGLEKFLVMLEPIMILILGGIITFIVIALALPIFYSYQFVGT